MSYFFFLLFFFFFNDTATTEIYTLSLHDALPIWSAAGRRTGRGCSRMPWEFPCGGSLSVVFGRGPRRTSDRKSTRLNSSHVRISYAVFCLKKKKSTALN